MSGECFLFLDMVRVVCLVAVCSPGIPTNVMNLMLTIVAAMLTSRTDYNGITPTSMVVIVGVITTPVEPTILHTEPMCSSPLEGMMLGTNDRMVGARTLLFVEWTSSIMKTAVSLVYFTVKFNDNMMAMVVTITLGSTTSSP